MERVETTVRQLPAVRSINGTNDDAQAFVRELHDRTLEMSREGRLASLGTRKETGAG